MPRRRDDSNGIKSDHPRMLKLSLHLRERIHRMRRQVHTGEAQVVRVLHHVNESDDSCPALRRVKPISLPRILRDIRVASPPDVNAIQAVIEDRNPDEEKFEGEDERETI